MSQNALQRYMMKRGGLLPDPSLSGPGDAEFITPDMYSPEMDRGLETEPRGLVDRLYRDQLTGKPVRGLGNNAVPTTKNRYT